MYILYETNTLDNHESKLTMNEMIEWISRRSNDLSKNIWYTFIFNEVDKFWEADSQVKKKHRQSERIFMKVLMRHDILLNFGSIDE